MVRSVADQDPALRVEGDAAGPAEPAPPWRRRLRRRIRSIPFRRAGHEFPGDWREARLMKIAPITQELVLAYVSQPVLGLPRRY